MSEVPVTLAKLVLAQAGSGVQACPGKEQGATD